LAPLRLASVPAPLDDMAFRESVFAWLRARMLVTEGLTRDDLSEFEFAGRRHRLVGTQTGIWRVKEHSDAAISILTAYSPTEAARPYDDTVGDDGMLRYKWRGTNANFPDNVWLRTAMERQLPLVWFIGIGHVPGTGRQVFRPEFPVWLVGEEPEQHQFVVAVEEGQRALPAGSSGEVVDIARRYNERIVRTRHHQPLFRSAVIYAYQRRCAVCRLPFAELLDAAHIKADADGGAANVTNGLALCKIHHGAFDANILGISPDYVVHVRQSVLETFDGPTLQHAIKEMNGERLRQLPVARGERPDRDLLAERSRRSRPRRSVAHAHPQGASALRFHACQPPLATACRSTSRTPPAELRTSQLDYGAGVELVQGIGGRDVVVELVETTREPQFAGERVRVLAELDAP